MSTSAAVVDTPLSHAIFRVARIHKAVAGRLLRETGLHPGQELVLIALWTGGPQRQVDLVRAVDSDAPSMARSLARLEKAGLVERSRSQTDRRSILVEATSASHQLRDAVESAWLELERLTRTSLSERDLETALATLDRVERSIRDGLHEQDLPPDSSVRESSETSG